jgi:hypothetical protein
MTSEHLYLLAIAAMALAFSVVFLWRNTRKSFDEYRRATEEETSPPLSWDALTSELGAKLFNPEDSDFVTRESPGQFARWFRRERAAFALDWLLEVRRHVNLLMRAHRRAARSNPGLKPTGELRLGFEFLLFQVMSGILYLVIWLVGPLHTASLVEYSLELAGQLRELAEDILPDGTRVPIELLDGEPQTKNRTASL